MVSNLKTADGWYVMGMAIVFFIIITFFVSLAEAANVIGVEINTCDDTIRTGYPTEFKVGIANDVVLKGFNLGFKIWSPDDVRWSWLDVGGYGPSGLGTGKACVTVEEGSRIYPPEEIFDLTGLVVVEEDVDGTSPDILIVGGEGSEGRIGIGGYQHILSLNFESVSTGSDEYGILCIDSISVVPYGDFVFKGESGDIIPTRLWSSMGQCFPVYILPNCLNKNNCGPSFLDHLVNLSTNHCQEANGIIRYYESYDGSHFDRSVKLNSGHGSVAVNWSYSYNAAYFKYIPSPEDAGTTVEVILALHCGDIDYDQCRVLIDVTGSPPELETGLWYRHVGIDQPIIKRDIFGSDIDTCDILAYSLLSGPGAIDPQTGVYSWQATIDDVGNYWNVVGVSDGSATVLDSFYFEIVPFNDLWGNANCNDAADVGDAVYLINYAFKNGPAPIILNWADVNGDCRVDVGDAVYLINYIFRSGAEPQPGCVN